MHFAFRSAPSTWKYCERILRRLRGPPRASQRPPSKPATLLSELSRASRAFPKPSRAFSEPSRLPPQPPTAFPELSHWLPSPAEASRASKSTSASSRGCKYPANSGRRMWSCQALVCILVGVIVVHGCRGKVTLVPTGFKLKCLSLNPVIGCHLFSRLWQ